MRLTRDKCKGCLFEDTCKNKYLEFESFSISYSNMAEQISSPIASPIASPKMDNKRLRDGINIDINTQEFEKQMKKINESNNPRGWPSLAELMKTISN